MSKYKEIKGFKVQTLASDTAASVAATGTWSSAGALNTDRAYSGGSGIATSGVIFGGYTTPGSYVGNTETYNGTAFTEVNDMSTGRGALGYAGATQSNALAISGVNPYRTNVEKWDGSSWTETGDVSVARNAGSGAGTSTAAIYFGGSNPALSPIYVASNESFNGSSWTEVGNLNTAKGKMAASGTSTAAFGIGGTPNGSALLSTVEQWNGSAWTETTDINTARRSLGGSSGAGSVTAALIFGGYATPAQIANTESWDGSSWTEVADMAAARSDFAGTGTTTSALASGGEPNYGATEQWTTTATPTTLQKINLGQVYYNSGSNAFKVTQQSTPAGTWASGGNLTVAKGQAAGAGTQTAGIFMGGSASPPPNAVLNETELYNGTSWTEVNNLNTARYGLGGANAGSQTATLVFAGYDTAMLAVTESWDGTNWTEVNDLNTAGSNGAGFGTQTAAIYTGGDGRSNNKTESWDGTNWTETTDLNTARAQMTGFGLATAGLIAGGDLYPVTSPTRLSVQTELWNGSSWTEVNDLNTGRRRMGNGGFGKQTSGLVAGGYTTTYVANTESWNGTSWAEQTEIQTRDNTTGIGTGANSGLIAGGSTSPGAMSNATEEWVVPEENQTITVS